MTWARRPGSGLKRGEPPEVQLLLRAARIRLRPDDAARIESLLDRTLEWNLLLRLARVHSLGPLLYRSLRATRADLVPRVTLEQLGRQCRITTIRGSFLTRELMRICELFQSAGIAALPYKGPVLAACVYGDLALRPFQDLDVLVAGRDYAACRELLLARGWRVDAEYDWETTFIDGTNRVTLDLHRDLLPQRYRLPLRFDDLYGRRRPVALEGASVPGPSMEDTLLCLCIQVAKDGWEDQSALIKICDLNELVLAHRDLDWTAVLAGARHLGAERILYLGLCLARSLLGTALPDHVLAEVGAIPTIAGLARQVRARLFREPGEERPKLVKLAREISFHFSLRKRIQDKIVRPVMVGGRELIVSPQRLLCKRR